MNNFKFLIIIILFLNGIILAGNHKCYIEDIQVCNQQGESKVYMHFWYYDGGGWHDVGYSIYYEFNGDIMDDYWFNFIITSFSSNIGTSGQPANGNTYLQIEWDSSGPGGQPRQIDNLYIID